MTSKYRPDPSTTGVITRDSLDLKIDQIQLHQSSATPGKMPFPWWSSTPRDIPETPVISLPTPIEAPNRLPEAERKPQNPSPADQTKQSKPYSPKPTPGDTPIEPKPSPPSPHLPPVRDSPPSFQRASTISHPNTHSQQLSSSVQHLPRRYSPAPISLGRSWSHDHGGGIWLRR
jgi:hypothetical protein